MKNLDYWLLVPFLFIILYSMMVNHVFFREGMTSGERSATVMNSAGKEEKVYVFDRVAAKSGPKKGIEGGIAEIDQKGNLYVSYNTNLPNQQFVVGENVVAQDNRKGQGGVKGKVTKAGGLITVSYDSGVTEDYLQMELFMFYTPDQVVVVTPPPYTPAVGDKVVARYGSKAWNSGKITDLGPKGEILVNHDTPVGMQRFMIGDRVAVSSGPNKFKVGQVVAADPSADKNVVVGYEGGTESEFKQSEVRWFYLKSHIELASDSNKPNTVMVGSAGSYKPAIGDKVVALSGSKEGIEGEVTDVGPDGTTYVTYNTTISAQKFVVGDFVAAKSGNKNRKIGKVTAVASNGNLTVTYDGGSNGAVTTETYKQTDLQMFYLKNDLKLKSAAKDSSAKSTPSSYESAYTPTSNNIIYYTASYDSNGKVVYTPVSWKNGGASGSAGKDSTGSSDLNWSEKDDLKGTENGVSGTFGPNGSSRGYGSSIDDSVLLGENSILADYTSPPDSAKSIDAKVDTKEPVADSDTLNKIYQLLNSLIERNHCTVSTYGCCKDNITAKKDVPGSNCSETRAVGLSDDVKKYIDTAVSEKTFTFPPSSSSLLQTTIESPPTNQLSTQASYTNTVFLAPPHGNYMYPGKCPNPADCKAPTYSNVNSDKLPLPLVSDFSKFGN